MLIEPAPHIRILEAIVATLKLVDFEDRAGVAGVTIRHTRNRYPVKAERPCISVRWVGNDIDSDEQFLNDWEKQKRCLVDLQADALLDSEDSEVDPTGWGKLSRMLAAATEMIYDRDSYPDTPLALLSDRVSETDTSPDDDSKPDEGRLVQGISVVYRVRADQPNVLLAEGEQG